MYNFQLYYMTLHKECLPMKVRPSIDSLPSESTIDNNGTKNFFPYFINNFQPNNQVYKYNKK
ncbi:hypothetical protein PIROE2DRAFT_20733 [Piromyces sp. E2]|nr:hypothetical protein PIROE2DRAFT_20733 [Piromyces sp. E2]|eukprot:OUM62908.1 hypothetical protein PIROE2DRAFT_20733 [Piromyces sp. E2]